MNSKFALVAALVLCWSGMMRAADKTALEFSPDIDPPGKLGTRVYEPTGKEKLYYDKLKPEERVTIQQKDAKFDVLFSLAGHEGQEVSWFGIVREIKKDQAGRVIGLRLEHSYSVGLTDLHLQTVSIYGGGDFWADVDLDAKEMLPLVLVRVYGTVKPARDGLPVVDVKFLRVWHWLQFNFNNRGDDQSNPAWVKLRKYQDRVYSSRVSPEYYIERLGPTKEQLEVIRAFHEGREAKSESKPGPKKMPEGN